MGQKTLRSQQGIIANTRKILNDMFTELYDAVFGGDIVANSVTITGNNSLLLDGDATVWDDLRAPFSTARRGALAKPDFDYTNIGLLFPQNDATEIIYMILQMPHDYKLGTDISPHIHWQQMNANTVVWKMEYKWFDLNEAVPAGFTGLTSTGSVFSYSSGNLHQLNEFADIDGSGISNVSSLFLVKIWRDDNVDGGAGGGDALAFEFDIHYQKDRMGSRTEYTK